jgi:SP family arabinose:H+ symporter-like MFS transporter
LDGFDAGHTSSGRTQALRQIAVNPLLFRSAVVAALGGLLFGFDTAVISGATQALTTLFNLSDAGKGFTVAVAIFGTIVGSLGAGIPAERYGARECLKVMGLLFLVSSLGCALAGNWDLFLFFRFLGGIGIGGSSVLAPIYIAEIAPASWRGRLVGCFQMNIVAGILLAFFSNYLVGLGAFGDNEWRVKFAVGGLPAALFLAMLFTIPRSPRWLAMKGQWDESRRVIESMGEKNPEGELHDIRLSLQSVTEGTLEPLFSWKYRFPIFLAVSIAAFNQLSGINGLLYYLTDIFGMAGYSKVSSDLQSVVIGAVNLFFTGLAMTMIDKVGRRALLLIGAVGTTFCLAGVAAIFLSNTHQGALLWLLIGYIAFFAFSQGAVIWVYISEVFPNSVRGKGQALGCFTHWTLCAVVSFSFPILAKSSGGYPFLVFAFMTLVQFFVVYFVYPETKGVSLEAMQQKLGIDLKQA